MKDNAREMLVFKLGSEEYGVDILKVQEIRGYEKVTPIPRSPDYLKGVVNLRGTIVPVIDLRIRFGMQRLLKKFETAKDYVPKPVLRKAAKGSRFGVIYYGSTSPAMDEALGLLEHDAMGVDALRVRAFPFQDEVIDFVAGHDHVFVVEQNRDGQLRTLLIAEGMLGPEKLTPVLHYDGTPITARFIEREIAQRLAAFNVMPLTRTA